MTALLDTLWSELGKAVPVLIGALLAAAVAWIKALGDRAKVREVVAESAVRQAIELHGDDEAADDAAHDELLRIPARYRPKDVRRAVSAAMERERSKSVRPEPSGDPGEFDLPESDRPTIPDADKEP